ncbi:MAG: hypothetical protein HC813_00720 [Planctomycetes bacterium]|nr:hypothetical protein [Planctomycetota bacterium]
MHLDFEARFLETIDTLRRTPGAYTFSGAVAQQMQFRALSAVLGGVPRAFMEYELGTDGKMKKLPFDPDFAQRILFGIEPALVPAHAYGAAVANFLTLQRYMKKPKFESKYHLRVWEDCGHILAMPEKIKEGKVEYLDLDPAERSRLNGKIVDPMFADPKARELHKIALDVSADLRQVHKGKLELVFGATIPEPAGRDAVIFDKLARAMFGEKIRGTPDPEQIRAAVAEHRRLASEFCLESVYRSSVEAFRVYRDPHFKQPLNVDGYRHLLRGLPEADWPKARQNLQFASRMTLLYSLYDLGWYRSGELMVRLHRDVEGTGLVELGKLWAEGRLQGLAAPLRNQKLREAMLNDLHRKLSLEIDLDQFTARAMRENVGALNEYVQRRVLAELGFKNVEAARKVGHFLNTKKLAWSPGQFAKNMVWDPGSIDALAQIVRAYVTSEGDMDHVRAVALDELVMAIPVAGQLVSLSRGGIQGLVLMAGAIQFPPFGVVLIVYSVGEAGYAIYDMEYGRHAANNLVDAIYRGFAGPETRAYDAPPPPFTDEDTHLLQVLGTRLSRARSAGNAAEVAELTPRVGALEAKKEAWKGFRDGSWAGGYFTEWGAIKEQKPILVSLLQDVPPILSYSPRGILDFRATYDAARLAEVQEALEGLRDAEQYLRLAHELDELLLQKERAERAERYLRAAMGDPETGTLSEKEKRSGVPELLHKLRRDSLYPALQDRAVRMRDRDGKLSTPNPDTFVEDWIRAVGDWAVRELNDKGVMSGGDLSDLPVQELKDRLTADYIRSRTLYKEFQRQEEVRRQQGMIRLQQRIAAYRAEAAGMVVEGMGEHVPQLEELEAAMLVQGVRRRAPVVEADFLVVRTKGRDGELSPKVEVRVQVRVKADPALYLGPYPTIVHRLDRTAAKAAIAQGTIDGIRLLPESRTRLEQLLRESGEAETMIPVVSVFATAMADLSKAPAATVDHLPSERTAHGFLMGQTVAAGRSEPGKEPEPEVETPRPAAPARIMMAVAKQPDGPMGFARQVEYEWKSPTGELCTFLALQSGKAGLPTATPHLWIEWPGMPEGKRLILEWKVSGGIPRIEVAPERTGVQQFAKSEFGLGAHLRTPGNKFTLPIPLGSSFRSAGKVNVEGRLMAFDAGERQWKTASAPAELPFRATIDFQPPPLEISGTSSVDKLGHASGTISIANAQNGRRLARIDVAGATYYDMFSGGATFRVPSAGRAPTSARITFRNFGEEISVDVPLKAGAAPPPAPPRTSQLQQTLDEIARMEAKDPEKYAVDIVNKLNGCQNMFTAEVHAVANLPEWLKYTDRMLERHAAAYEKMANPAWPGWAYSDFTHEGKPMIAALRGPGAAAGIAENRAKYAGWYGSRLRDAIECSYKLGRVDLLDRFLKMAETNVSRMPQEKKYAGECWKDVARGYARKAELVFHATGSFAEANALTEKSHAAQRKADALTGNKELYNPFRLQPDPEFDPGR